MSRAGFTRRELSLIAAASLAAPSIAVADPDPTLVVVAEGGAAEERIADTRSAYDLAIAEGCDFIQASLAPTKEGALVAHRGPELSASTDVEAHPEFADRKTSKTIDGTAVSGWFPEDFTLAELQTLMRREPDPARRPQTVRYNGKEPVLSLADVLRAARDGCLRTGRVIGVCARLQRPAYYADLGFDVVQRLASELDIEGYRTPAAAIWIQANDPDALAAFGKLSRVRRMLVMNTDDAGKASQMLTPEGVAAIRAYAEGIAPDQGLVLDLGAPKTPAPLPAVADAQKAGLAVFARVTRSELSLPPSLRDSDWRSSSFRSGDGDLDKLLVALFAAGVDGVDTPLPGPAAKARTAVLDAERRAQAKRR